MKRQRKKRLPAAELRAMGMTPGLVTRRLRPSGRGNRLQPTKDNAPEYSRRTEGGG
jgi:hypothetical protein